MIFNKILDNTTIKRDLSQQIKQLKPIRLMTGYYIIEADNLKVVMYKDTYNSLLFETKTRAINTIKNLKRIFKKTQCLPEVFIIA